MTSLPYQLIACISLFGSLVAQASTIGDPTTEHPNTNAWITSLEGACTNSCSVDITTPSTFSFKNYVLNNNPYNTVTRPQEQAVLHYSMDLDIGSQEIQMALGDITFDINEQTVKFRDIVNKDVVKYTYTRQMNGKMSLNWLVSLGSEMPSDVKVFIQELDEDHKLSYMSPLYGFDISDDNIKNMARDTTVKILDINHRLILKPKITISNVGTEMSSGTLKQNKVFRDETHAVACLIYPNNAAMQSFISNGRCSLNDWEENSYISSITGSSVIRGISDSAMNHVRSKRSSPYSGRKHFHSGDSLAALTTHQICNITMRSALKLRPKRGIDDALNCAGSTMSLVALYALAHSWDSVSTVINQAISNPDGGGELERLIRANPAQARLTLTMAASEVNSFIAQSDGNTSSDALNADVLVVPCVADGTPCPVPPNNTNALVERNYLNGSDFLGDGEEVSFSTSGTQNWSIDRLLRADMQLQQRGYVFVGYHGTTIEAARSIVFGGIRARTQALDNRWSGFYISTYPVVAYGYALDQEPDANNRIRNGIMLRVYVPKASLQKFYSTDQTLAAPDAIGNVEQLIGHPLPLQFDSITGAEDHDDVVRVETILGWQLAEQAVAIPSTIPTDPTNVGGDLDPSTIPAQEQEISPLPDYVTETSHHHHDET